MLSCSPQARASPRPSLQHPTPLSHRSQTPSRPFSNPGAANALLLFLPLVVVAACSPAEEHAAAPERAAGDERPNIILITVDSLRADRLSYAGNERPTSPAIDRFFASGVSFETAYSQAGWTLPSVSTILSGRYPSEHGATRFGRSIQEGMPLLAMILKEEGYATEAIVSHVALQPRFGLARGFDAYDQSLLEEGKHHKATTAEELTDRALTAISKLQEPYCLWLHYFDPHFAYIGHPEWAEFGDENLDRYDSEIAYTDKHVGRFLEGLDASAAGARSVVLFSADHGEEFGEHAGKWHDSLYDEVARIPLVLRAPGLAAGQSSILAEQIDFLPTLLKLAGVAAPADLPGRDLLDGDETPRPIFLERARPPRLRQRAVRLGDYKLLLIEELELDDESALVNSPPDALVAGTYLFDIVNDPGETHNLFDPGDEKAQLLLDLLVQHFASLGQAEGEVDLDEDFVDQLRALGYFK